MPVACIAVPGCGCFPCFVPNTSIFGMTACACAWVSVKFVTIIVWFVVIVPLCVPEIEGYKFEGVPMSKTFNAPEVVNIIL